MKSHVFHVFLSVILLAIGHIGGEKIDAPIPCIKRSDCRNTFIMLPEDAFCENGYCMCPNERNGFKPCSSLNASVNGNKVSGPLVYRTCKHNQDCNFEGGFCNSTISQCDCMKDYVPSSNKQRCVQKVSSMEAPCADENQCLALLANTTCENSKCVCASGYHLVDNKCWGMVEYEQPCTRNEECSHVEGVICTDDMICQCAAGTVLNSLGSKCLPTVQAIRDICIESVQCSATFNYSSCIDKTCQCDVNYHYESTQCFPNRALNENCTNDYECYDAENDKGDQPIKSMKCEADKCTCAENYVFQEDMGCVSSGSSSAFSSVIVSAITLLCGALLS